MKKIFQLNNATHPGVSAALTPYFYLMSKAEAKKAEEDFTKKTGITANDLDCCPVYIIDTNKTNKTHQIPLLAAGIQIISSLRVPIGFYSFV